ncbi:MAG: hypothetical protein AB7K24_06130 [Gemmataceae bacterium]
MRQRALKGMSVLLLLAVAGQLQAQSPYGEYNRARAYRHFLNSPYSYRTYSAFPPATGYQSVGPFSAEGLNVDPGYIHQRITPRGFESYRVKQGYQNYYATPFTYQYQAVPSVGESYYSPTIPPDANPFGIFSPPPAKTPPPPRQDERIDPPPAPGIPAAPPPLPGPTISNWVPRR